MFPMLEQIVADEGCPQMGLAASVFLVEHTRLGRIVAEFGRGRLWLVHKSRKGQGGHGYHGLSALRVGMPVCNSYGTKHGDASAPIVVSLIYWHGSVHRIGDNLRPAHGARCTRHVTPIQEPAAVLDHS